MKRLKTPGLVLVAVALAGCTIEPKVANTEEPTGTPERLVIMTDNYPVYFFASEIVGDDADVKLPVPKNQDPAYWQPDRDDIQAFQEADLILLNGAGYAQWAKTASLPEDKVVETTAGFTDELIQNEEGTTHSHGPEGEHTHFGTDFNTWLNPILAMKQAAAVRDALIALLPDHEALLRERAAKVEDALQHLDTRLTVLSQTLGDRPLLASHPVYNYLARRYHWNLKSMHWEPGDVPTEEDWAAFDALVKEHPATIMLWEDEPHAATKALLDERGIQAVVFVPCANRPANGDYIDVMDTNITGLEDIVANSSVPTPTENSGTDAG